MYKAAPHIGTETAGMMAYAGSRAGKCQLN